MRFLANKSGRPSQRVPLGDHDRESMREDDGLRMRVVVDLYFGQKNRLHKVGLITLATRFAHLSLLTPCATTPLDALPQRLLGGLRAHDLSDLYADSERVDVRHEVAEVRAHHAPEHGALRAHIALCSHRAMGVCWHVALDERARRRDLVRECARKRLQDGHEHRLVLRGELQQRRLLDDARRAQGQETS